MIATGVGNTPRVERPASGSQVEETEGAESRNGDDAAAGGNGWRTVPGDMTASRNAHIVAKSATTIRSNRPGNAAGVPVGTDSFTMKKDGGGREKIGAVVQEGTNSWTFVTTLVDGIATTVQKAREDMHETQRELRSGDIKIQPVDFDEFYKMDREGAARRVFAWSVPYRHAFPQPPACPLTRAHETRQRPLRSSATILPRLPSPVQPATRRWHTHARCTHGVAGTEVPGVGESQACPSDPPSDEPTGDT